MGLKDLHTKFKAFRIRRFLLGSGVKSRNRNVKPKPSWMSSLAHGYHHVIGSDDSKCDSNVVQRETMEGNELWFFGIFDAGIGNGVTKYLQSHFFSRKLKQSDMRRKCKEATKKAYLDARAKIREEKKSSGDAISAAGAASATVINEDKLVLANMGNYRAVVCRDGVAHQINNRHQKSLKGHWYYRLFSGDLRHAKGSELVAAERIDSSVEFVILGSSGIWEVLKYQEAVSLIRHIEHPQEAAECLTKEAVTRMSRSSISCLIIRFE